MKELKESFSIKELAYYGFFAVMLTAKGFGFYEGQWPYTLALILAGAFIFLKMILTRQTLTEWIISILLLALGCMIYLRADQIGALIIIATIIGMKDVAVDRVMKLGAFIWIVSFTIEILLSLTGVRSDIFRVQEKLGLGHILRWSLGQPHPNVLQISFMLFSAFILYLGGYQGKKLLKVSFLLLLGNVYIFIYSVSYTGMLMSLFYLAVNMYFCMKKGQGDAFKKWEAFLIMLLLPFASAFSVLGPILLKGKIWELCNKALNTRFAIAKTFMELNPVSLFGVGYCNELPVQLNNLDCSYVYALMHYGIIFFALYVTGYFLLIGYCVKKGKRVELAIILASVVAAVSEPFFANPSFKNISVVFLGELLYTATRNLCEYSDHRAIEFFNELQKDSDNAEGRKMGIGLNILRFMNREVLFGGLENIGEKTISLDFSFWKNQTLHFKSSLEINMRKGCIIGAGVGFLLALVFALSVKYPTAYYMNRTSVQIVEEEYITLDINNLPDDFEGKILEYKDSETPMQRMEGNICIVEKARGVLSVFVWGWIAVFLVIIFLGAMKKEENKATSNEAG